MSPADTGAGGRVDAPISSLPHRYRLSGLSIAADLGFTELLPEETPPARAAVRIELGDGAGRGPERLEFVTTPERTLVSIPQVGRFEISGGNRIVVHPVAGAADELVRQIVLGSAWAAILRQRGAFPLHGSAIAAEGRAVAFCGPPGAGKSTISAWLAAHGFPRLSDDMCRLDVAAGAEVMLWPSPRQSKLTPEALAVLGADPVDHELELPLGKRLVPWSEPQLTDPHPLACVYLLEWGEPRCVRLTGLAAVRGFLQAGLYRPGLVTADTALRDYWQMGVELARRVAIWELRRPRDFAGLDTAMDPVLTALARQ